MVHHGRYPNLVAGLRSFSCQVHFSEGPRVISISEEFCGVEVPQALGIRILARLCETATEAQIAKISHPAPRYLFITELDCVADPIGAQRLGGEIWQTPDEIVLPTHHTSSGNPTWIIPPHAARAWLPRF